MNPINRIGQKVVCLKDLRGNAMRLCPGVTWGPERDKVYTVTGFEDWFGPGIHLKEAAGITCDCDKLANKPWPIECFRPVDERKTDISAIKKLENPVNHSIRELESV